MQRLYFILVGVHLVAIVVTGVMWTIVDLIPESRVREHLRDIQAVHFGSLYLVPILLGLSYAFEWLHVPSGHQIPFPAGLGLLVLCSGVAYLFPRRPGVDPFYYWTKGWAAVLSLFGLACLIVGILWTATVLIVYAVAS